MDKVDVVVTGYGLVAPTVLNARSLFALLGQQGSCLREHPEAADSLAGFIDEQQWQAIADALPPEAASHPRHSQLSLFVAGQALGEAGLDCADFRLGNSGLFMGCQPGQERQTHDLAQWLGVHENVSSHADAGAAGTIAIGNAYRAIAQGEIDLALCGGVALLCEGNPQGQASLRGAFIPSEAAALVVLESAAHAERRGARPLGRVLGYADLYQGEHAGDATPYTQCMQAALHDAGLAAREVRHVNLHSPSPLSVDRLEAQAIKQVFGTALPDTTFAANKFAVGHSLAGSGAIEAVLSLMTLQLGVLLPTPGYTEGKPRYATMHFPESLQQQAVDAVLSNSFAAHGANSSLVLGRA